MMALPIQQVSEYQQPSPIANFIPAIVQGMQMKYMPAKNQADLQNEQLKNAALQIQNMYAPQMSEAEISLKQALSAYKSLMAQNPLLSMPGSAGQIGAIEYLRGKGGNQGTSPSQTGSSSNLPDLGNIGTNKLPVPLTPDQISQYRQQYGSGTDVTNRSPLAKPLEIALTKYNSSSPDPSAANSSPYSSSSDADVLQKALMTNIGAQQARADYTQKRANAFAYATAPVDAKTAMIAQLHGMGLTTDEGVNELASGKTIPEIATEHGFDPKNMPAPDYDPTRGNVDKLQQRRMYLNELDSVQDFVNQSMAPYSRKFMGYSPKQVVDAIRNEDPDQQARFIAARGLQPELASMRLNVAGGRVGLGAIQEMKNAALGNSRIFEGAVSPQVYQEAQQLMNQQITNAFNRASKNLLQAGHQNVGQPASVINSQQPSNISTPAASPTMPSSTVRIIGKDGKAWIIPRKNLQSAIARGAREVASG